MTPYRRVSVLQTEVLSAVITFERDEFFPFAFLEAAPVATRILFVSPG